MNTTPRLLNRAILLCAGLACLGVGACALAAAVMPEWRAAWERTGARLISWLTELIAYAPVVFQLPLVWLLILVAIAVLLALGVLVIARQGGGRTATLLKSAAPRSRRGRPAAGELRGTVTIDVKVAEVLLKESLAPELEVLSVRVSAHTMRGSTAMRVSLGVRRGTSPATIVQLVEETIGQWDALLGKQLPIVIEITSPVQSRWRSELRAA
ncbi:hypothetical protein ACXR2W_08020 [Leucobacter sp. HY1908]